MKLMVLDDIKTDGEELTQLVEKIAQINGDKVEVSSYSNPTEAIMDVENGRFVPDIAFLDIKLGKENGINAAKSLLEAAPNMAIVFITAYDDYYIDVYDVSHVHLIKKPATEKSVKAAYLHAVEALASEKKRTAAKSHFIAGWRNCWESSTMALFNVTTAL